MIQPTRFPKGNSKIRRIFDLANLENDTEKREIKQSDFEELNAVRSD